MNGETQLVYISPENIICNPKIWFDVFCQQYARATATHSILQAVKDCLYLQNPVIVNLSITPVVKLDGLAVVIKAGDLTKIYCSDL